MINRVKKRDEDRGRKSGFVYRKRDPATLKARAEQQGGRFDSPFKQGFDTFRPKPGENLIRFLPPMWEGAEHYALDIWVHRFIGADSSTYLCLNKMQGKHCPICAAAKAAKEAGETDEAKQLGAVKNALAYIVNRDEPGEVPLLYAMSWTMDRDITGLCQSKRSGSVLWIDNPDDGYDVTIKRTGQGIKTRYSGIAIDRQVSNLDDDPDIQDKLLEFAQDNPLPDVLQYYPEKYLEKVLEGTTDSKEEELEEDEAERPARSRKGKEEDEEEKPRGRRAKEEEEERPRGRRAAEEEEEERPRRRREDPEEDERPSRRRAEPEEEEEAPRSRRKAEPEEEEEAPRSGRRGRAVAEEEEEAPRSRRRAEPEEEEAPRSRRKAEPEEEEEEKPRRGRGKAEEEEEDPPRRRRASSDDESEGKGGESEEEEEEKPRRGGTVPRRR